MRKRSSWKGLLGLGLATLVSLSAMAQDGRGRHHHGRDDRRSSHREDRGSKKNLSGRIYRITEADSVQKLKLKPAIDRASKRLESLRLSYQKQEKRVLDSLSLQAKSILKDDQWQKLNTWKDRTGSKK
ncbi:MAG TPA: hypothetical protein VKQ08_11000 [Cyclobacteriaceae bacterium]|nr:hypothetical protein [Cyclobacteriaceae bacterium]